MNEIEGKQFLKANTADNPFKKVHIIVPLHVDLIISYEFTDGKHRKVFEILLFERLQES